MTATPKGLRSGGKALWTAIDEAHDLDAPQLVQLEEACRAKDRLDQLDKILRGHAATWVEIDFDHDGTPVSLNIAPALAQANATANLLKQLLAALRLPDVKTGQRPQRRAARGAYAPRSGGASKDRLKAV